MATNADRPDWCLRHHQRDTSTLAWNDGRQGEFFVRGGVCWPELVGDRNEGFAVIVAQSVHDARRMALVVEQHEFYGLEPIIGDSGVAYPGIAPWFNMAWQAYACRSHYYRQTAGIHDAAQLAMARMGTVKPTPRFVEGCFETPDHARGIIQQWTAANRLKMVTQSKLYQAAAAMHHAPPGATLPPCIRALAAVLSGIERSPWRRESFPYEQGPGGDAQ